MILQLYCFFPCVATHIPPLPLPVFHPLFLSLLLPGLFLHMSLLLHPLFFYLSSSSSFTSSLSLPFPYFPSPPSPSPPLSSSHPVLISPSYSSHCPLHPPHPPPPLPLPHLLHLASPPTHLPPLATVSDWAPVSSQVTQGGACPDIQDDVTSVSEFRDVCTSCISFVRPLDHVQVRCVYRGIYVLIEWISILFSSLWNTIPYKTDPKPVLSSI